jgi:cytochrome c peroxidase
MRQTIRVRLMIFINIRMGEVQMKQKKTLRLFIVLLSLGLFLTLTGWSGGPTQLTDQELLGKKIFLDKQLSLKKNQSCASCHAKDAGWTGPIEWLNKRGAVYFGSVRTRFGNRKPPTVAYAGESPVLHREDGTWVGGMFWDGRATGWTLDDPLAEQAQGPFLNPLEQALPDADTVVQRVSRSSYSRLFNQVCEGYTDVTSAYNCIAFAIAAYERSPEVSRFSSKYDAYLNGKAQLTAQESRGYDLFIGQGNCSACHISDVGDSNAPPLFTDYTYDNLGIPRNPDNPFYYEPEWNPEGRAWVDKGLGAFLESQNIIRYEDELGKQKVPTLRNVDKRPYPGFVKAYGHNGYFKSLKAIVHFYNTRDIKPQCPDPFTTEKAALEQGCWPVAEIPDTVNHSELGDLGLSPQQEDDLVAFLKTLSDGYLHRKR